MRLLVFVYVDNANHYGNHRQNNGATCDPTDHHDWKKNHNVA